MDILGLAPFASKRQLYHLVEIDCSNLSYMLLFVIHFVIVVCYSFLSHVITHT